MAIDLPAGRYVVAVSGGVDSVVLLDIMAKTPGMQLTVTHFDHGIREDSAEDRKLVQSLATQYGLPFVYTKGHLGPKTSEAAARQARYAFLHSVRSASGAAAIVTAHHEDDVVETVILNLLRGTGRRGLSSLGSTETIKRPLLHMPKKELLRYAKREGLRWREDSTNSDTKYLRNHIRIYILPRFAEAERAAVLNLAKRSAELNKQTEAELAEYLRLQPAATVLDRHMFIALPHNVSREVLAAWLRKVAKIELSKQLLERLVVASKTGRAGSRTDVKDGYWLEIRKDTLALVPRER